MFKDIYKLALECTFIHTNSQITDMLDMVRDGYISYSPQSNLNSTADAKQYLRGPSFKGGDCEKSHHGHEDVVEVEITVVPDPLFHHGQCRVPVVVENVGTSVI